MYISRASKIFAPFRPTASRRPLLKSEIKFVHYFGSCIGVNICIGFSPCERVIWSICVSRYKGRSWRNSTWRVGRFSCVISKCVGSLGALKRKRTSSRHRPNFFRNRSASKTVAHIASLITSHDNWPKCSEDMLWNYQSKIEFGSDQSTGQIRVRVTQSTGQIKVR